MIHPFASQLFHLKVQISARLGQLMQIGCLLWRWKPWLPCDHLRTRLCTFEIRIWDSWMPFQLAARLCLLAAWRPLQIRDPLLVYPGQVPCSSSFRQNIQDQICHWLQGYLHF